MSDAPAVSAKETAAKFEAKPPPTPPPKPKVIVISKGGWTPTGHSGGGISGHEGKYVKKPAGKKVVYNKEDLPPKKSLNDLP
jgi:hypothetical protein